MQKTTDTGKKTKSGVGFRRIRRVTGYLVGDVSLMNDSKRTEASERVKHFYSS